MAEQQARTRILAVATDLFAEKGYGGTSVREVTEAADVTKPTLYYYFQDKEALFLEVVRRQTDLLRDMVEHAVNTRGSVKDRLKAFIEAHLAYVRDNASGMRLLMTVHHKPDDGRPPVDLISVHKKNGETLGTILAEGVRTGELRADLPIGEAVLTLVGILNLRCAAALHGSPADDEIAARILDLYFHGVGRRDPVSPDRTPPHRA